jgi:hypothetical protein
LGTVTASTDRQHRENLTEILSRELGVGHQVPVPLRVGRLAASRRGDDEIGPVFTDAYGLVVRAPRLRTGNGQDDKHLTGRGPSAMSTQLGHDRLIMSISFCRRSCHG